MKKETKTLEKVIRDVIKTKDWIYEDDIKAIASAVREWLPDENEIGFLVYRKLTTYDEEEAKERWTGKHCIEINKDLAEMIGTAIAERLNAK